MHKLHQNQHQSKIMDIKILRWKQNLLHHLLITLVHKHHKKLYHHQKQFYIHQLHKHVIMFKKKH